MAEVSKKSLSGIVLLTSFLAALGTSVIDADNTPYYCADRDLVCLGHRLSESGKTCYYLVDGTEKGARCTEGWTIYSMDTENDNLTVDIYGNNCLHTCTFKQALKTHTLCYCQNGQWAYAGELI